MKNIIQVSPAFALEGRAYADVKLRGIEYCVEISRAADGQLAFVSDPAMNDNALVRAAAESAGLAWPAVCAYVVERSGAANLLPGGLRLVASNGKRTENP